MENSEDLSIKLLNDKESKDDPVADLEYNILLTGSKGK